MTSLERTAYPYLSAQKSISAKTLDTYYVLTQKDLDYIEQHIRGNRHRFNFAVQLKIFQNLGYFVDFSEVPKSILDHLKKQMRLPYNLSPFYEYQSTLSRHRDHIRDYLKMTPWGTKGEESAQRIALQTAYTASQTMNHPADIINVVIEALQRQSFELPVFNTLDRLVRHVRSKVNQGIFQKVIDRLKVNNVLENFDELLLVETDEPYSNYQKLKESPKAPTLTNFRDYVEYHAWLMKWESMEPYLQDIPKVKLKQFAEEAKSLDVDNLKDIMDQKKYTLIGCLLYQAQQTAKDTLGIFVCKTLFSSHKKAHRKLESLKKKFSNETQNLAKLVLGVVQDYHEAPKKTRAFASKFKKKVEDQGGFEEVEDLCQKVIAYNSKNHIPFLWEYFRSKRSALFDALSAVDLRSTTQNQDILSILNFLKSTRHRRSDFLTLDEEVDLSFISKKWKRYVYVGKPKDKKVNRRYLELCAFSYLANDLRSGDLFIEGADAFSDYRLQLLSLEDCELLMENYLQELDFPKVSKEFVEMLKNNFLEMARKVDNLYPNLSDFFIDKDGLPVLKRTITLKPNRRMKRLIKKIHKRMPERNLLDTLCLTQHLTGWAHEFGPISGIDPRLENPTERYILNVFCQGTGLGPTQGAKHIKNSPITSHMLSWINRRHVTPKNLDAAKNRIINYSQLFLLTTAWGDGSRCAADGTLRNIYEDNLLAESHFRYKAKGGIAYNHISDTYVALFSTFIPCGVWEAVEIIDGLLKNDSSVKPNIVHADTQGQSAVVFGLCYLLGIRLMPRIRNWKDLTFFRPDKETYKNIDALFGEEEINWDLIETHLKDMLQVILSIRQGKISSSFLLKKLTTYSRKNRLYHAFQELGRVIRTQFLLEYISNTKLREIITATTNKVEAFNAFSDWIRFGSKRQLLPLEVGVCR